MKLVLATDRSSNSKHAAETIEKLPFRDLPATHIISVVPIGVETPSLEYPAIAQTIIKAEEKEIREHLDAMCQQLQASSSETSSSMSIGAPSYEIIEKAEAVAADLIVLGAVGKSAVERVILGSVSDFVCTHASCSTLVVRKREAHPEVVCPKRIVLALSNTDDDRKLVSLMEQFKWASDTEVHLLHVMERTPWHDENILDQANDYWNATEERIREHASELERPLSDLVPSTQIKIMAANHIGEAVVKYGSDVDCDLIVTGDSHRGFLNRVFLGSTSRYILRHADCSVAIARG